MRSARAIAALRRAPVRLFGDLAPRALGRLGFRIPSPKGQLRPLAEDYSIEVPFRYDVRTPAGRPVAVVCHIFHVDLAAILFETISRIESAADIYISTDTEEKCRRLSAAFARWTLGTVTIRLAANRGRDIAPKLVTFRDVYAEYDIILFLHSKQSPHLQFGQHWRDHLLQCLIGSPGTVASILEIFRTRSDVGMIIPQHYPPMRDRNWINWGNNFLRSRRMAWRMNFDLSSSRYVDLPSGSMFWSRSKALRPLLDLNLSLNDFQSEQGQIDMTTAHCVERLFLYVCELSGLTWLKVADRDTEGLDGTLVPIEKPSDIDRFIKNHRFDLLKQ